MKVTSGRVEAYRGSIEQGWMLWHVPQGKSFKLIQDREGWELLMLDTATNVRRGEVRLDSTETTQYPAWVAAAWHTAPYSGPLDILSLALSHRTFDDESLTFRVD